MLLADFGAEFVEGDGRAGVVGRDQLRRDPRCGTEEEFSLGRAWGCSLSEAEVAR
jgi:hypothetical protein